MQPTFTDGHNTGLYSWDYLYKLGSEQEQLWKDYLTRLHASGFEGDTGREAGASLGQPAPSHGCGHNH